MATTKYDSLIEQVHQSFPGVPAPVVKAVIATESNFRPDAYLEEAGGDGSIGLMQIRLSVARGLGFAGTREQLTRPEINVVWGTKLLERLERQVRERTGKLGDWPAVVSAYNGGFRPALGFGQRVTRPVTVCLRTDPATGKCLSSFTAQPGEFGNQPHVDRWQRWYNRFTGGAPPVVAAGFPALLILAVLLGSLMKRRTA